MSKINYRRAHEGINGGERSLYLLSSSIKTCWNCMRYNLQNKQNDGRLGIVLLYDNLESDIYDVRNSACKFSCIQFEREAVEGNKFCGDLMDARENICAQLIEIKLRAARSVELFILMHVMWVQISGQRKVSRWGNFYVSFKDLCQVLKKYK